MLKNALCSLALLASSVSALPSILPRQDYLNYTVDLRIEALTHTVFERRITSFPRIISTPSGGAHPCTGLNNGANTQPGATCTTALDEASKQSAFRYDGTYDEKFDDYFITSIDSSTQTATQFWGLLRNYQFTPVGGCQQLTAPLDKVLWAFDAFNKKYFLRISGPSTATLGKPFKVTVTDGTTGIPIEGATVGLVHTDRDGTTPVGSAGSLNGPKTDANGIATITPTRTGITQYKAQRADSIRSNRLDIVVS
jgi:hypothetical protein